MGGLANGAAVPAVLFVTQNVSTFPHICRPTHMNALHTDQGNADSSKGEKCSVLAALLIYGISGDTG